MSDSVPAESKISVEWNSTFDDILRRSFFQRFQGRRPAIIAQRVVLGLLCLAGLCGCYVAYQMAVRGANPVSWFGDIFLILLGPVLIALPRVLVAWSVPRTVGALGPHTFEATSDYVRMTADGTDTVSRWRLFPSLAMDKGDIYLIVARFRAGQVPGHAFGSEADVTQAFAVLSKFHSARLILTESVPASADTWPPPPQTSFSDELPTPGPPMTLEYSASAIIGAAEMRRINWALFPSRLLPMLGAFLVGGPLYAAILWPSVGIFSLYGPILLLVIFTGLNLFNFQRSLSAIAAETAVEFETDYQWVRIKYPGIVSAIRVATMRSVRASSAGLFLNLAPNHQVVVPTSVFGSPGRTREVADRMRAVIRQAKRA